MSRSLCWNFPQTRRMGSSDIRWTAATQRMDHRSTQRESQLRTEPARRTCSRIRLPARLDRAEALAAEGECLETGQAVFRFPGRRAPTFPWSKAMIQKEQIRTAMNRNLQIQTENSAGLAMAAAEVPVEVLYRRNRRKMCLREPW